MPKIDDIEAELARLERLRSEDPGREYPDPRPVEAAVGNVAPPSMLDQIRAAVRGEVSRQAAAAGHGSFAEEDDFSDDDDPDPSTPYEIEFEGLPLSELRRREEEALRAAAERQDEPEEGDQATPLPDVPKGEGGRAEGKRRGHKEPPSRDRAPPPDLDE